MDTEHFYHLYRGLVSGETWTKDEIRLKCTFKHPGPAQGEVVGSDEVVLFRDDQKFKWLSPLIVLNHFMC